MKKDTDTKIKSILHKHSIDLVIVMDCTGSMGSWINQARDCLGIVIDNLKAKFKKYKFRLAFVGYRDIQDSDRFSIHPFSEDIEAVR